MCKESDELEMVAEFENPFDDDVCLEDCMHLKPLYRKVQQRFHPDSMQRSFKHCIVIFTREELGGLGTAAITARINNFSIIEDYKQANEQCKKEERRRKARQEVLDAAGAKNSRSEL
jgi:hypothetical protein